MAWLSISLELEAAPAEAFSEALLEAGAHSIALDPAGQMTRLTVLAACDSDPRLLIGSAASIANLPLPVFATARLEDEDWVLRSQSQFTPIRVTDRLWVVPSWHAAPDPAAIVLRIDPGLAFGTGGHPSTRLVLGFLEKHIQGGERVLDCGCGSGILAIAAAKLGAGEIAAVDVDAQALATSASNARINGVALRIAAPEAVAGETYDVVVANILAGTLIDLEPVLARHTRPGGRIALSGILDSQAAGVAAAYAQHFSVSVPEAEEGWSLLEGLRT